MSESTRQIIVMRKDLNMRKGKMVAQGAHASMKALLDAGQLVYDHSDIDGKQIYAGFHLPLMQEQAAFNGRPDINRQAALDWLSGSFTKICVSVDSEEELLEVYNKAKERGLLCSLIVDNGLTEFNGVKTITCCAVGPAYTSEVNEITGHLKLL